MTASAVPQRLVVAIGGNATHPENIRGTTEEQEQIAARAARALRALAESVPGLVITHGNGPVVGKILLRQYYAREHIVPMRLDVCVAHSQGGIGHLLMQGLEDELARAGSDRRVACLVTRVAVDASGRMVIAFEDHSAGWPATKIRARRFNAQASPLGPDFVINESPATGAVLPIGTLGYLDPPHSPRDRAPRLEIAFGVNAERWLCATVRDLKKNALLLKEASVVRLV